MCDQWQALFDVFAPFVERHCDCVIMWDRPGAKARRALRIKPGDWRPFEHLMRVHDDVESGIFTGFYFLDRLDAAGGNGCGPCSFRFFVGSTIRVEASIPLADWHAGLLDVDAAVAAIQALPYLSFMAGYGLSIDRYPETPLIDYAQRYAAVDLVCDEDRGNFTGGMENYADGGVAGIAWITGVGEPFRTRGRGTAALGRGAPADVQVTDGPHGVVFRLGATPISDEAGVDDATLPLFHWLGRRLAKPGRLGARNQRAPTFGVMAPKQSLAWERRFTGQR